jgi:hypothetical protein
MGFDWSEKLKDVLPIIEKAAPLIAGAIGGPQAEAVVCLLANAFDLADDSCDLLPTKMLKDSNLETKLKTIESDNKDVIKTLCDHPHPSRMTVTMEWDKHHE